MRNIGIIGAGSLGTHLSRLICRNKWGNFLTISDKNPVIVDKLQEDLGIWAGDTVDTIGVSDIIFVAVKPNNIKSVCKEINKYSVNWKYSQKLIVSVAAGVPIDKMEEWLDGDYKVIRCMPNIPISNGDGSIVWYSNNMMWYDEDRKILDLITDGPSSIWVEKEDLIDSATVAFGCTPAYVAKFFKTYVEVGSDLGFNKEESEILLRDTFNGTLGLLDEFNSDSIIEQVASKGGATEKGLEKLDRDGFTNIIRDSAFSSLKRIQNITKSLD